MNVLVYSGPGVSKTSLAYTLTTLRSLLLPNYTVQPVTPQLLESEPWTRSCALLVIPGGRDLPYISSLANSTQRIKNYVQDGGAFLGICAGAYYASQSLEWEKGSELEVTGERPLAFFPGLSRGCVYPGFEYATENGARAVKVDIPGKAELDTYGVYYNGGGEFVDAEHAPGVHVVARYADDDEGRGKVAAVRCVIGKGTAVLWHLHPEYPLKAEPAYSAIRQNTCFRDDFQFDSAEEKRIKLVKDTLRTLGLTLPSEGRGIHRPLPQFLLSAINKPTLVAQTLSALHERLAPGEPLVLQDNNDALHFHSFDQAEALLLSARTVPLSEDEDPSDPGSALFKKPKIVIACRDGKLPPRELTPLFDTSVFFRELSSRSLVPASKESWSMGELLLYGEAVTSTQTMLDRNNTLLTTLPTPLLSLASQQLTGRGRGTNAWLSPAGCLQFSLLLRLSLNTMPAQRLVFIQYLFGLAVVQAVRQDTVLGKVLGEKVRLKWPNDIYAVTGPGELDRKKIGGILVSTSFRGGLVDIVIGCGLNVLTSPPITSLFQLVPPGAASIGGQLTLERVAASIMSTFNRMWSEFLRGEGDFAPFNDLYHQVWLHSDQVVTLTTVTPQVQCRIVGITEQYGLLRVVPEGHSQTLFSDTHYDLQPDGNSFDLMSGLIKTKT